MKRIKYAKYICIKTNDCRMVASGLICVHSKEHAEKIITIGDKKQLCTKFANCGEYKNVFCKRIKR